MKYLTVLAIIILFSSRIVAHEPPVLLRPLPELNTVKTGLLIGIQKGKYFGLELGMERQWKEIKLKKPRTFAIAATGEYQFEANTVGFKVGPWWKFGRADFTYGINATVLSDFDNSKFGVSPAIGFKLIGFHILASYNITSGTGPYTDFNKLHLSLRYYISKSREFNWKKSDKKKKD
jgi:hypothetical protein